jgi:hypothetical protein
MKTPITTKLRVKLIRADTLLARTITYLGKLIFLITSPRATTELSPLLVTSAKKFHSTIPNSIEIGQLGMPSPIFRK